MGKDDEELLRVRRLVLGSLLGDVAKLAKLKLGEACKKEVQRQTQAF